MSQNRNQFTILVVSAALLVFGGIYAVLIAVRPFRAGLTWLSVVIGDGVTDLGASVIIYNITKNKEAAAVPFLAHMLTGSPMIVGQVLKHVFQDEGVIKPDGN